MRDNLMEKIALICLAAFALYLLSETIIGRRPVDMADAVKNRVNHVYDVPNQGTGDKGEGVHYGE